MKIPADTRTFTAQHEHGWAIFRPNGKKTFYGAQPNPWRWTSGSAPTYAARLFVGLSVDSAPTWKVADVVRVVRRVRERQVGNPSSSFLTQHGVYRHESSGEVVEEEAVQVIIINSPEWRVGRKAFEEQMVELAETLAGDLEQEEVILEIQKDGVAQKVGGVSA